MLHHLKLSKIQFLAVFFMIIGFDTSIIAAPPVMLESHQKSYVLGLHLDLLEDQKGLWTLEDVTRPEVLSQFIPSTEPSPNFGFTQSAYWIKVQINSPFPMPHPMLLEVGYPHHDRIDLYLPSTPELFVIKQAGDLFPFEKRDLLYHNFIFNLVLPPLQSQTLYLRFQTQGSLSLPLTLWESQAFSEKVNQEQFGFGLFFGIMLVMGLYNLFIYFVINDKTYIHYVLYIGSYILFQMSVNGFAFEYLWPNFPQWANISLPMFLPFFAIFALIFCRSFLETQTHLPVWDKFLSGYMVVLFAAMFLPLVFNYAIAIRLTTVLVGAGPIFAFPLAFVSWKNGLKTARFFLIAWSALMVGGFVYALKASGLLPSVFVTEYAFQIGSVMEVVLLSLALADRFKIIRLEKEKVQAEALEQQRLANEQLESKVSERTKALQNSLFKLDHSNKVFQTLLETSTALTHAKKLEETLHFTLKQFYELFESYNFGIIIDGGHAELIECKSFVGISKDKQNLLIDHNASLLELATQSLMSSPGQASGEGNGEVDLMRESQENYLKHLTVFPMIDSNEHVIGKLIIEGPSLTQDNVNVMLLFLEQVTIFSENKLLNRQLVKMANTDALTGIFNRAYFEREYHKAIQTAKESPERIFSMMVIDVNGLKRANDVFGHKTGDLLIDNVVKLLKSVCRQTEILARVGGDEFVVLCHGTTQSGIQTLLERIRIQEKDTNMIAKHPNGLTEVLPIRISIGTVSSDECAVEEMYQVADERMYQDKQAYYEKKREIGNS
ncbi:7TM diverse intracellular signaling domain-containing protein [Deltaproteobacteria bacterium TL4]